MFSYPPSSGKQRWTVQRHDESRGGKMMKKLVLPLGAAMVLSMVALSPAGAFTMTQKCVIANELCFVSRASAGGFTPEQRIDRVNERLAYILGYENLRPGNIRMAAM